MAPFTYELTPGFDCLRKVETKRRVVFKLYFESKTVFENQCPTRFKSKKLLKTGHFSSLTLRLYFQITSYVVIDSL